MRFVVRQIVLISFFSLFFYSSQSYSRDLVMAPINDPLLQDLQIRYMFVDKSKRVYLGTDSGLYRYANKNLVKLDGRYEKGASSFNGPISNIMELNERYLAINTFPAETIYYDRQKDGYVIAPYNIATNNNYITTEKISDNQWLWKTSSALYLYTGTDNTVKKLLNHSKENYIYNFKYNPNKNSLYVATSENLYTTEDLNAPLKAIFSLKDQVFPGMFLVDNQLHLISVNQHITFKNGELISSRSVDFCTQEQLERISHFKYANKYSSLYFHQRTTLDTQIMAISECGVFEYDLAMQQTTALQLPDNQVNQPWIKGMSYSTQLPLILDTNTGVYLLDNSFGIQRLKEQTKAGRGGTTFSVVKVSDDQYLIADGTPGLKVASSRVSQFNNVSRPKLEKLTGGNSLRHVIKENINTLWISSQTNGLIKAVKKQGDWHNEKHYLHGTHVRSLYLDENKLWVATEGNGLHQINILNGTIKELESPENHLGLLNFLPLSSGELLIGSTHGVLLYNKRNGKFVKEIDGIFGNTWALVQNSTNDIWIGSHVGGLYKLDENFNIIENYTYKDDLYNSAIMGLAIDQYDQPVVATWGGGLLYRRKNETKFSQLSSKNGLLNDTIQSIIKTAKNQYWLSTQQGISHISLCHTDSCKHQIKSYTTNDGLSSNLFDLNSANLNPDGSLIFGGYGGLTWFDPKKDIVNNTVSSKAHFINRLEVDEMDITNKLKESKSSNNLTFSYKTNHIDIIFNSDDYIGQSNKRYRYRINNSPWTVINSPQISLSALSHGSYKIEATSSNSDGIWSENLVELRFIITPPWWLAPYSLFTYGLIVICLVVLFVKFRNAQLTKQNILLEQKVTEKTSLLTKAIADKEHMFESSSHELQTPITLILNYLDLLSKKELSEKNIEYISVIKSQSQRLRYLVKNMLLSAELGSSADKFILVDIVALTTNLVNQHQTQADKSNISLFLDSKINGEAFVNVVTDSIQIIFGNLIDNAIKYSPQNTNIIIELYIQADEVIFCISDQGPGFKDLNKIGSKYYRETQDVKGTGLGLSNVKYYVSKNSGTFKVTKTSARGSKLKVTLPVCYQNIKTDEPKLPSPLKVSLHKQSSLDNLTSKILLVEDDPNLTLLFKSTLAKQFNIHFCRNGKEALRYLEEAKDDLPEVIISDVMMPEMNGFEFCNQIKNSEEFKHIPLLLLTAKSDNSSQYKGLSVGADDYIYKPFEMKSLQLKVSNIIKTNKARQIHQLQYITSNSSKEKSNSSQDNIDPSNNEFAKKVRLQLSDNIADPNYKTSQLAHALHVSESTLNRKLKQHFGQSFTTILKKARMNKAKTLLNSDRQIQTIVECCGYTNHSYFNKHFKEEFNLSPKALRAKLKESINE
ncbi:hybrid sensor histidine kinase/response regulator transcription factor [Pseudoalteromonas spongiae]|uniref:hybrid sensor histidine kinase/response regulator transcription factor n=1 Tax=Pseudoalteromonas spongiae TaxID=298657 RepID=UPI00110A24C7|nr:response regulator [Pseudoalteromonas spongiae]TMO83488.1 hypothetical protein CWC15_14455 [Pseudoalteromonas spongiae]